MKRLGTKKSRVREGLVLVEGTRAVSEALGAGVVASFVVTSPRLMTTDAGRAVAARLSDAASGAMPGCRPFDSMETSDVELTELAATDQPQGVLLVCEEPTVPLGEVLATGRRLLVLDAIQDPGNVGTLIRSAVAFGLDGVVALGGTGDPFGAKSVRASAGTAFLIPVARGSVGEVVAGLGESGHAVLVASAEGTGVPSEHADAGFALVLGNEGAGVRDEIRLAAAGTVSVEMTGPAESLNVGIAGSILMHELTRERG